MPGSDLFYFIVQLFKLFIGFIFQYCSSFLHFMSCWFFLFDFFGSTGVVCDGILLCLCGLEVLLVHRRHLRIDVWNLILYKLRIGHVPVLYWIELLFFVLCGFILCNHGSLGGDGAMYCGLLLCGFGNY